MSQSAKRFVETYLVTCARLGDRTAQKELVSRYQAKFLRHAYRLLGDSEQARDAVQDGWTEILRGLPNLREDGAFAAWAFRIVSRRCAKQIAGQKRRRETLASLAEESVSVGRAVQTHTVDHLYAHYTADAAYVSIGILPANEIADLAAVALADPTVASAVYQARENDGMRFLNYVLPTQMFISEVPGHLPDGVKTSHTFPEDHDRNRYKIVFTKIQSRPGKIADGRSIVLDALNKTPVVEAWINRAEQQVVRTFLPSGKSYYGGAPVPVF